MDNPWTMCSFK